MADITTHTNGPDALHTAPLTDWRGDITTFESNYETQPLAEHIGLFWGQVIEVLAPKITVLYDKAKVNYFIPCRLKVAPLVQKTLQRAVVNGRPTIGKQRSTTHVTEACMLVFDFDDIKQSDLDQTRAKLEALGIAALCYSSFSYGVKEGIRCRLIIPVAKPLNSAQYKAAHAWVSSMILCGPVDSSGAGLYQCQGVWASSINAEKEPFKWVLSGGALVIANHVGLASIKATRPRNTVAQMTAGITDQAKFDFGLQVLADATDIEILKALRFTKKVADGNGRESTIIRLAGLLRQCCVPQERIEKVCHSYSESYCQPPIDDNVVIDKSRRYDGQAGLEDHLAMLARDVAVQAINHAFTISNWARVASADEIQLKYLEQYHRYELKQFGLEQGA